MTIYPVIKRKRNKTTRVKLFRFKNVPVQQEEDIKLPKKVVKLVKDKREFYDFVEESHEIHSITADPSEILDRIRRHRSSSHNIIDKIDELQKRCPDSIRMIINAREKDPGLIHQIWVFLNYSEVIKIAVDYLQQCINPVNTIIYTHNDKITSKYPYDHVRHCSREDNDLWVDAQALIDIYVEVTEDTDAENKFITVGDVGSGRGVVARVRNGSDMMAVIQNIYGIIPDEGVFTGTGIMKGYAVVNGDKINDETAFISYCKVPEYNIEGECLRCGECRQICPAGLVPGDIVTAIETNNTAYLEKVDLNKCNSCGMCSYVCSADRMLSQKIYNYKNK